MNVHNAAHENPQQSNSRPGRSTKSCVMLHFLNNWPCDNQKYFGTTAARTSMTLCNGTAVSGGHNMRFRKAMVLANFLTACFVLAFQSAKATTITNTILIDDNTDTVTVTDPTD